MVSGSRQKTDDTDNIEITLARGSWGQARTVTQDIAK